MNKLTRRHLAREVVRLLASQPQKQASYVQQLAAYLVAHKRTNETDLLVKDIADELFMQQNHLSVQVESAYPLAAATKKAIHTFLVQTTKARSVELQSRLDPTLLGGVVLRTPRQELNTSLRRKLKAIAGGTND